MFLGMVARYFLSFLVSNWIYSEAVLFFPPIEPVAQTIYQKAKIPTHDKWDDIASSTDAATLEGDIQSVAAKEVPGLGSALARFFDGRVREIWKAGSIQTFDTFFASDTAYDNRPFLTGDAIFAHRVATVIRHDRF